VVYAHDHRGHGATAAAAGQERLAQKRAELQAHTLSELQRRATDKGTDNVRLDAALDSKNPAEALVTLLLEFEEGEPGVGEEGFFSDQDGWQLAVDDAVKVSVMIREREQRGLPLVLLGHSMGSMLGRTLVAQYGKYAPTPAEAAATAGGGEDGRGSVALAGFICTGATGVADPLAPAPTEPSPQVAEMLAASGPRGRVPMSLLFGPWNDATVQSAGGTKHSENDWLSRDPAVGVAYGSDPLCCVQQWGNQMTVALLADLQSAAVRAAQRYSPRRRHHVRVQSRHSPLSD
jgi:alpha-beta hydrolase superfamily lysophospholipase